MDYILRQARDPGALYLSTIRTILSVPHMPAVPIMGLRKRRAHVHLIHGVLPEKVAPVTRTVLRSTGPAPADSRW